MNHYSYLGKKDDDVIIFVHAISQYIRRLVWWRVRLVATVRRVGSTSQSSSLSMIVRTKSPNVSFKYWKWSLLSGLHFPLLTTVNPFSYLSCLYQNLISIKVFLLTFNRRNQTYQGANKHIFRSFKCSKWATRDFRQIGFWGL